MGSLIGSLVRLLLLCLVVGLLLAYFDITPSHIVTDTIATLRQIVELGVRFVDWAAPYVMLGAVVVVPVAVIVLVLRLARR